MTRATPFESFGAEADAEARLLILGSMPSVESQRRAQYYAHPQNLFWRFMGELFGTGPEIDYANRLARLRECSVALWDVAHRCQRISSADATIRAVEPNDFAGLFDRCPKITTVLCNGRSAEQMFRKLVVPGLERQLARIEIVYLPSTSPANAALPPAQRLAAWRAGIERALGTKIPTIRP